MTGLSARRADPPATPKDVVGQTLGVSAGAATAPTRGTPDWDGLRLCLAVARSGTALAAARSLGMSHSTLVRRLAAFELRLGVVLFYKRAGGYAPNESGRALVALAETLEAQIGERLAALDGADHAMRGVIRFAAPDLAVPALGEAVRDFAAEHPEIAIVMENACDASGLTLGEAHVALVLTAAPPPGQVGVRFGPIAFAAYASAGAVAEAADFTDWVGFSDALRHLPAAAFDRRLARGFRRVHACDGAALHLAAIRAGLGIGALACAIGDTAPDLVRVSPPVSSGPLALWLLQRREQRGAARATAFFRRLRAALDARRTLLAGGAPARPPVILARYAEGASWSRS